MSKKKTNQYNDSLNNYVAGFGVNGNNVLAHGSYSNNFSKIITRDRYTLSQMYRSSWIVGKVIDVIAEDMTKNGVDIVAGNTNVDINALQKKMLDLSVWEQISTLIKWGKLYGGAIGVIMIDGEDITTPLDIDRITKDSYKGIAVYDRWQVQPSYELVTEYGADFGLPKSYTVYPTSSYETDETNSYTIFKDVHYTRVIRSIGIELPNYERIQELYWGESIVERLYDRILIFDSATYGASNLIMKSFLRVLKMTGLREGIAAGGVFLDNIQKYIGSVQAAQASNGMYVVDTEDELQTSSFSFAGMDKALTQFGEQLSGSTGIPIVRLFGQPPAGFNSTGEVDLRSYFDTVKNNQQKYLQPAFNKLIPIIYKSSFGSDLGDNWSFDFVPLWQPTDLDKAEIAKKDVEIVGTLLDKGVFDREMALNYLIERKRVTGRFGNINEEDFNKEIPTAAELMANSMVNNANNQAEKEAAGKDEEEQKPEEQENADK